MRRVVMIPREKWTRRVNGSWYSRTEGAPSVLLSPQGCGCVLGHTLQQLPLPEGVDRDKFLKMLTCCQTPSGVASISGDPAIGLWLQRLSLVVEETLLGRQVLSNSSDGCGFMHVNDQWVGTSEAQEQALTSLCRDLWDVELVFTGNSPAPLAFSVAE